MPFGNLLDWMLAPFDWVRENFIYSKTFKLAPLPNSTKGPSTRVEEIFGDQSVTHPSPVFLSELEGEDLSIYDGKRTSPAVHLHLVENATVFGRTEFVLAGETLYYPDIIDPDKDAFMAELEGRGRIAPDRGHFRLRVRNKGKKYSQAVSILGQCNGNYLHFLTEALTRLAIIDQWPEFDDLPLVVEDNLHPRLYEALDLLNVKGRDILRVAEYESAFFKKIIYITPPCYTPPETRKWFEQKQLDAPRSSQFKFSPGALEILRSLAVSVSTNYVPHVSRAKFAETRREKSTTTADDIGFLFQSASLTYHSSEAKNFYCERRAASVGNGRLVKNEEAVISHLRGRDFASINLADFSFAEQVLILQNSNVVVSAVGAALGNLIFVAPGVNVILLSPTYPGASFFYFVNLLSALGHKVTYVLGRQDSSGDVNPYNRDFWAPVGLLTRALEGKIDGHYSWQQ
jgi:hypothetical protein